MAAFVFQLLVVSCFLIEVVSETMSDYYKRNLGKF